MEKIYSVKNAVYTRKSKKEVENVETLSEHVTTEPTPEVKLEVLVNELKLNEEVTSMKVAVTRKAFKELFGPKSKPKKGDALSIEGLQKKFKVKKAKKFSAKKKGKGYKLTLKAE